MIGLMAKLMALVLAAIGVLHTIWATGGTWPAKDERALAHMVAGFRDRDRMPSEPLTIAVAMALFIAAFWAIAMVGGLGNPLLTVGGAVIAAILILRGLAGFTPQWRALTPQEPFARLDRLAYSPLSLALGAGFVVLVLWRLA